MEPILKRLGSLLGRLEAIEGILERSWAVPGPSCAPQGSTYTVFFVLFLFCFSFCSARSPAPLRQNEKQNEARNRAKQRLGRALEKNRRGIFTARGPGPRGWKKVEPPDARAVLLSLPVPPRAGASGASPPPAVSSPRSFRGLPDLT